MRWKRKSIFLKGSIGFLVLAAPIGIASAWQTDGSDEPTTKTTAPLLSEPEQTETTSSNSSDVTVDASSTGGGTVSSQSSNVSTNVTSVVSGDQASTSIVVNGQDVPLPANGTIHKTLTDDDGQVDISVSNNSSSNNSDIDIKVESNSSSNSP